MAIISSDDITLTRVDDGQDGDDGYSPQVTVTQNTQDTDSVDINVETKNNQTGVITTNTTTIKKADRIYTALRDMTTFNQLTNGGELQGIFLTESGHAYFNGQYLHAEGADIGGWTIGSDFMKIGDTLTKTDIVMEYDEDTAESEYEGEPSILVGGLKYSGDGGVIFDLGSYFEVDMKDSIDNRDTSDSHIRLRAATGRTTINGGWSLDSNYEKYSTTSWTGDGISAEIRGQNTLYSYMDFEDTGLYVNGVNVFEPAEEILAYGNYTTLNSNITLTKPYTDFRFILFRFGGGSGQGTSHIMIPTNTIFDGTNYSTHQAHWYAIVNSALALQVADVKFTDNDKIQITYKNGSGTNWLRQVKGIY